jgi:septal ring factor EnvC (AmiA/AmiB activator)
MLNRNFFNGIKSLLCIVGVFFCATSLWADSTKQAKALNQVDQDIKSIESEIKKLEKNKQKEAESLEESAKSVQSIRLAREKTQQDRLDQQAKIDQTQADIVRIQRELEQVKEQISVSIRQMYPLGGSKAPIKLLLNQDNPQDSQRYLFYFKKLHQFQVSAAREIQAKLAQLKDLELFQDSQLELLAQQEALLAKQQEALDQQRQAKEAHLQRLSLSLATSTARLSSLQEDQKKLADLVRQLREQEKKAALARQARERELEREKALAKQQLAKQQSAKQQNATSKNRLAAIPKPIKNAPNTASLVGVHKRFKWPLDGKLVNRFGVARDPAAQSLKWNGIQIQAKSSQAKVLAAGSGDVVFADWLRGYGLLVIVQHSDDFLSLYGQNEALYVKIGDSIKTGQVLASLGPTSADSRLYFELRRRGNPIDPLPWLAN